MIETVSLIGMGALGILYGKMLTEALGQEKVSFLTDQRRLEEYRSNGIFSNGRKCSFSVRDYTETIEPPDLLIFAVKGTSLESALETARNHVGKNTTIISLLNGISSEEIIAAVYGKDHLIYCVAQGMDAVRSKNSLEYAHKGELRIGLPPSLISNTDRLTAVSQLFSQTSVPYQIEADITHRMWSKWMLNVGVNQVVMVCQGTFASVQKEGPEREMMKAAMHEVVLLSEKENTGLSGQDLVEYVALVDTLNPQGMPSMRQDGIAGRKTEVELFSGTVIKKAQPFGLSVPVNRLLYEKIKETEKKCP
jgi:2-dehydropantoate 2-reductase